MTSVVFIIVGTEVGAVEILGELVMVGTCDGATDVEGAAVAFVELFGDDIVGEREGAAESSLVSLFVS